MPHIIPPDQFDARPSLKPPVSVLSALCLLFACSSAEPTKAPADDATKVVSPTLSTVSASADTVTLGRSIVISVVPRTAAAVPLGSSRSVSIALTGGTGAGSLSEVRFFVFDSSYRATFIGQTAGTPLRVRVTVDGTTLDRKSVV